VVFSIYWGFLQLRTDYERWNWQLDFGSKLTIVSLLCLTMALYTILYLNNSWLKNIVSISIKMWYLHFPIITAISQKHQRMEFRFHNWKVLLGFVPLYDVLDKSQNIVCGNIIGFCDTTSKCDISIFRLYLGTVLTIYL
jgi:hypothetical protein